jgi:uncharacterized phage protein gp47/JayE
MPYDPDTQSEVFEQLAAALLALNEDANPRAESTIQYAFLFAVAGALAQTERDLKEVYNNAYVEDATGEELTKKARNLGVERQDAVAATGVVTFSRDSDVTTNYTIPSGTIVETVTEDPISFETTAQVTLASGTKEVDANIVATEGGTAGNVGAGAIQAMPSPPTGVESVANQQATGDPTLTDTNGDPLIAGENRETDPELRQRVLNTEAIRQGPDADGIELALTNVDGVISIGLNTNQESTAVDGIDPYHSEIVVFGGAVADIAQRLYDIMSVPTLLRLQGGVNGTKESADITSDLLEQTLTIPITRPQEVTADVTIDVVHDSTFDGTDAVKDTIIGYVGGTDTDGASVVSDSVLIGEDVLINEIENRVEDLGGVEYANVTLIDEDGDGTDDRTTDSDGVPVLAIGSNEVARFDASAIAVNTTQR